MQACTVLCCAHAAESWHVEPLTGYTGPLASRRPQQQHNVFASSCKSGGNRQQTSVQNVATPGTIKGQVGPVQHVPPAPAHSSPQLVGNLHAGARCKDQGPSQGEAAVAHAHLRPATHRPVLPTSPPAHHPVQAHTTRSTAGLTRRRPCAASGPASSRAWGPPPRSYALHTQRGAAAGACLAARR